MWVRVPLTEASGKHYTMLRSAGRPRGDMRNITELANSVMFRMDAVCECPRHLHSLQALA